MFDNLSQFIVKANANVGLVFQQLYTASNSEPLPEWLGISGMALNYEATLLEAARQPSYLSDYRANNISTSTDTLVNRKLYSDYQNSLTVSNGILDFTNGFLIPAISDVILGAKYKAIESGGIGVDLELGLNLKWLSKYGVGVEGMAASQTSYFFAGADKGDIQEIIYASAGAAGLFGTYLPILSYTYKHQKNVGASDSSLQSSSLQSQASANPLASVSLLSTDAQPQNTTALNTELAESEPSNSSSGTYSQAGTGANTPFTYNPNFASTSSAAPTAILLGANTKTLYAFEIFSGSSAPSSTAASLEEITIRFAGSGLTPTTEPVNVDILGTYIDHQDKSNRAQAAVTINADGTLASVEINKSGLYSYLLETGNKSGEFILPLGLIGAGLVADPSTAQLPLVSIPASYQPAQSGLVATPVLRIPSIQIAATAANTSSTSSETNFPVYNSQTNTTTAPNSGNLATYSYSGVPLTLASSSGEPLTLLNQNLTARTIFSNGQLIAVEPEQTIYFNAAQRSADGYQLTVNFQAFGTQQDNPDLAALGSATVSIPEAQELAYNNVVSESGFSAQVGSTNAGVYLSDGHTDTTPLLPEQGVQPVFNRVVYNNNDVVWYLNATDGGVVQPDYLSEAITNGEAPSTFSAAISPVAVTIASPASSSSATNSFGGDTLVAWVEATDPVIPLTSENGEQNFQAFMDALYGKQRINYRIQQSSATESSGWAPMDEQKISSLYQADQAVITQLKAFNTHNPNSNDPADQITLLAWVETPLPGVSDQTARLKVAIINPTAPTYSWDSLTSDADGNSTIQTQGCLKVTQAPLPAI